MTDSQRNPQSMPAVTRPVDEDIDLFDYFRVIRRARWMIVVLCVVAMAATVAIMLTRPRYYRSAVTIMPPLEILQKEMGMGGLGAMGSSFLRSAMGGLTASITGIYEEILKSRELGDRLVDQLHLMETYEGVKYRSDARRLLAEHTTIETTEDGAVKIAILDRDPNRAAAIANAYVAELDRQNKRLSGGQATSKRVFLEGRLKEVESRLSEIDNILSREAKTQEMLYELLVQQYEIAKIEEAKSLPTIQVLDEAVVPELPVPRGTVVKGVLAGVTAFLLGIFLAFTREYAAQARRREEAASKHGATNLAAD